MDQGAHFQTNQKPLTVMNVHNRARNHLSVGVRERETERERERERGMWIDGIQQPNDREAKTALPLSALIVG